MILPGAALAELTGPWLWAGYLVFLRVGAVIALAPVFGEQTVPVRVRLGAALAFALALLPVMAPAIPAPRDIGAGIAVSAIEVLVGLVFGILIRTFILALQIAGSIAAQSVSLAQIAGAGVAAEPAPAIGHLLVMAGLALAATAGLHVKLATYLLESYRIVPPGHLPGAETIIELGIAGMTRCFALAFSLALPFVVGALLYNLVLGVISRAMPQLMVTFIGAPFLTGASLVLLMLAAPLLLDHWRGALDAVFAAPAAGRP